jgi:hypothetical protein
MKMEKCKRICVIEEELTRITNLLDNPEPEWHEWWNAETIIQLSTYRVELAGELCDCSKDEDTPEDDKVN